VKTVYHQPVDESRPRRGDLFHSNVGDRRERTFLVIGVRVLPTRFCKEMGITAKRTRVWAERWWELEPDTRIKLARSAERAGGQNLFYFKRFPAKRKPTFEQLMRREVA
jgi:hypothetical protein